MHAQLHLVQNALDALHRINSLLLLQCQLVNVAIPARMDLGQHRLSHLQIVTNSNVGHKIMIYSVVISPIPQDLLTGSASEGNAYVV